MSWTDDLARACAAHGVTDAVPKLTAFVDQFARWNQKINLSAARTPDEITQHVIDCMALLPYMQPGTVADVGSGGGLPGCILAICNDDLRVTSFEPVHKKAAFQSTAARTISFALRVQARRVDPALDHGFDIVVSRATFDLTEWLTLGAQLIRPGGLVLGMEGREHHALPTGASRHPYDHGDRTRSVIVYRPS